MSSSRASFSEYVLRTVQSGGNVQMRPRQVFWADIAMARMAVVRAYSSASRKMSDAGETPLRGEMLWRVFSLGRNRSSLRVGPRFAPGVEIAPADR